MTPSRSFLRVAAACLALAGLAYGVAACGSSGRELRDPVPGATAPPRKESAAGTLLPPNGAEASGTFGLASEAWNPGGTIPENYTCDGAGISPPFAVFAPPEGTIEMALVVSDVDAPFVHWIVAGIAPGSVAFQAGQVPDGASQAANTAGVAQYTGMCPPEGEEHTYEFAIYALDGASGVTAGQDPDSAIAAITAAPLATATLTGRYGR